jgi:hypothetical protein
VISVAIKAEVFCNVYPLSISKRLLIFIQALSMGFRKFEMTILICSIGMGLDILVDARRATDRYRQQPETAAGRSLIPNTMRNAE